MQRSFIVLAIALLLAPATGLPQPKSELGPTPPIAPEEGRRMGQELVANLLAQSPEQKSTTTGTLVIRDGKGGQQRVPVRFEILPGDPEWRNTYESAPQGQSPGVKLTIVHSPNQPNQYLLGPLPAEGSSPAPRKLTAPELMTPFAASDFWLADLGLEFLHWPGQQVLKKQMRRGLSCHVLQSTFPNPVPHGYARVLSWIAINRPDDVVIVHAEAYDRNGTLLKEFAPKKVEKINGAWQLSEMEIRNRQTGSRTKIEFNLDSK
jgi:hypothetical protein